MDIAQEVTQWVVHLSRGDKEAERVLWKQYFTNRIHDSRRKLEGLVTIRRIRSQETSL